MRLKSALVGIRFVTLSVKMRALLRVAEVGDDLADREHADRDHDEADAVGQLGDAEA